MTPGAAGASRRSVPRTDGQAESRPEAGPSPGTVEGARNESDVADLRPAVRVRLGLAEGGLRDRLNAIDDPDAVPLLSNPDIPRGLLADIEDASAPARGRAG